MEPSGWPGRLTQLMTQQDVERDAVGGAADLARPGARVHSPVPLALAASLLLWTLPQSSVGSSAGRSFLPCRAPWPAPGPLCRASLDPSAWVQAGPSTPLSPAGPGQALLSLCSACVLCVECSPVHDPRRPSRQ